MSDIIPRTVSGQESVADYATLNVKESFATFFNTWADAVDRGDEDTEHVHQLRVSSRRARASLELFAELLPKRKAERLLEQLDNVRKSAGAARDGDVFLEKLEKYRFDEQGKQKLVEYLKQRRTDSHDVLVDHYERCERGEQLERQALDLLTELRPRGRDAKSLVCQFNKWVRVQLRNVSRDFFAEAEVDTNHLESLHQFRIRSKQFRYCLEILQPALPVERFKKAYSDLKKLTQRLGEINDHTTAVETLSNLLKVDFSKSVQQVLRRWRKEERRALRKSVAEFAEWWTPRRRRRMRRRLKNVARERNQATLFD